MADQTLNDEEIALMCDIAQNAKIVMTTRKQAEIERLIGEDFIRHRTSGEEPGSLDYVLTGKGQQTLAELGVGANES